MNPSAPSIVTPMSNGQPICSAECATFVEEFNAECHPRLEAGNGADAVTMNNFLALCQGVPAAGGGHRRMESTDGPVV